MQERHGLWCTTIRAYKNNSKWTVARRRGSLIEMTACMIHVEHYTELGVTVAYARSATLLRLYGCWSWEWRIVPKARSTLLDRQLYGCLPMKTIRCFVLHHRKHRVWLIMASSIEMPLSDNVIRRTDPESQSDSLAPHGTERTNVLELTVTEARSTYNLADQQVAEGNRSKWNLPVLSITCRLFITCTALPLPPRLSYLHHNLYTWVQQRADK